MKKKQDEKHYKMLRSIASLQHNKTCFDCGQKGPTYINMSIGSFVCTACSGILRGLNPPQRVKSISMTSFTADELEFILCRGNEFSRKTYMAHYDTRRVPEPDLRDEQKKRDFLSEKYERKRWYAAPSDALLAESRAQNQAGLADKQAEPSVVPRPRGSLGPPPPSGARRHHGAVQPPPVQPPPTQLPSATPQASSAAQASTPQSPKLLGSPTQPSASAPPVATTGSVDLLADLGADLFSSSSAPGQQPGFANFGEGTISSGPGAFNAPPPAVPAAAPLPAPMSAAPLPTPTPAGAPLPASSSIPAPAKGNSDKYAALADLDSIFSTSPESNKTSASTNNAGVGSAVMWESNAAPIGASAAWGASNTGAATSMTGNGWGTTATSSAAGWNSQLPASASNNSTFSAAPGTASANPFGSTTAAIPTANPFMSSQPVAGAFHQQQTGAFPQQQTGSFSQQQVGAFPQQQAPTNWGQTSGAEFAAFGAAPPASWGQQQSSQPAQGWGQSNSSAPNPFMNVGSTGSSTVGAPMSNSTNPFL